MRLSNHVGSIDAALHPVVEPYLNHPPQPRPIAVQQLFERTDAPTRRGPEGLVAQARVVGHGHAYLGPLHNGPGNSSEHRPARPILTLSANVVAVKAEMVLAQLFRCTVHGWNTLAIGCPSRRREAGGKAAEERPVARVRRPGLVPRFRAP